MAIPSEVVASYNDVRTCRDKRSLCHAPRYSMYFGRDGLVSACCYSRRNALGRYPDQSIAEIWFGNKRKELRGQMRRNILPAGCEICADQLRAGNFKGLLAAQFDSLASKDTFATQLKSLVQRPADYPSRMEFELSNKCNLECSMCNGFFSSSIRSNREGLPAMPQVYDAQFVAQLRPFVPHMTDAKFLGGEPFLVDLYYEIWELFIENNPTCNISITTNATVYTEKVKRVLEKLNCQIVVSLDSLTKDTYESIRKNAVFSRTLSNLEAFTSINRGKGKRLTLAICPMVSNWQELPEILSFANSRGMRVFFNTVISPKSLSLKYLTSKKQGEIIAFLRRSPKPTTDLQEVHNYAALEDFCQQLQLWRDEMPDSIPVLIAEQCKLYQDRFSEDASGRFRSLISVLSVETADENDCAEAAAPYDQIDPIQNLRDYVGVLWRLGTLLTADGLLPGSKYQDRDLKEYLMLLEGQLPETTLQKMYAQITRFPMEMLQAAGTNSPQQLVERAKAHFSNAG
jgi:MoaA/NifB/PqqE/SkfB family radical SAM enzyme